MLACGPSALLSHRSAASLWGLRPPTARLEVTIPRGRAGPRGVERHGSRLIVAEEVAVREGIPVTSVAHTLLDLAGVVGPQELARALDRAERLGLFDLDLTHHALARASGRRAAGVLLRAIAGWLPHQTLSELEDRFQDLLSQAPALPAPRFNVLVTGERAAHEVDAVWQSERLAVELDGFGYHRTRRDRERDAATDADLELAGYRVLRLR